MGWNDRLRDPNNWEVYSEELRKRGDFARKEDIETTSVGIRVNGTEVDMIDAVKVWASDPNTDTGSLGRAAGILDGEVITRRVEDLRDE